MKHDKSMGTFLAKIAFFEAASKQIVVSYEYDEKGENEFCECVVWSCDEGERISSEFAQRCQYGPFCRKCAQPFVTPCCKAFIRTPSRMLIFLVVVFFF